MVFRKRGRLKQNETWTYGSTNLEVVDSFNYLGTVFIYNSSFCMNNQFIIGKALRALSVLLVNCDNVPLRPKTLCQLFDSFVGSILNYSSENWGFTKSKEIERIHLKFCKRVLKVSTNSCTFGVYGELSRYPIYISRYCRIIKYLCKVINTDNVILNRLYNLAFNDFQRGKTNWVSQVKNILDNYGFSELFDSYDLSKMKSFSIVFKQRVIDCFYKSGKSLLTIVQY